jgi:malate dehydrogenase
MRMAQRNLGDIMLLDVVSGLARGKALDILEMAPVEGFESNLSGTSDYADTAGTDVIVVCAGVARRPGMSRDDLLAVNANVVRSVVEQSLRESPDAYLIIVTNPVDAMTCLAKAISGLPRERVMGMAGVLDSARLRAFIAMELDFAPADVHTMILGGHGDDMVPIISLTTAGQVPVSYLLPPEAIGRLVERARTGGGEIVTLLQSGSAFYAPGAAIARMVDSILGHKRRILNVSAHLEGEYGHSGVCAGVPGLVGPRGLERIIELDLTSAERELFDASVGRQKAIVREMVAAGLMPSEL